MSVPIKIDNVVKRYGDSTIIPGLSTEIGDGEFFTLLGPSGCGKTTLLRMIAGFNSIEAGDVYFGGTRINDMDPAKRKIGMVFQNYAIFPHLTVRKNVEFGLKNSRVPRREAAERADEYIRVVQMDKWADVMPDNLSGGQQQRVALARALVTSPDVLLMDEPLSNLDAKLRVEMREIIRDIQRRVGITTVYVTHDQEEAMAVSDRIAVMQDGVIQQLGSPRELYHRPANKFVAGFIGRTNELDGLLNVNGEQAELAVADHAFQMPRPPGAKHSQKVRISARPEQVLITPDLSRGIPAEVTTATFLGVNTHYGLKLDDGTHVEVIQESDLKDTLSPGEKIGITLNLPKINIFDEDGSRNLTAESSHRQDREV